MKKLLSIIVALIAFTVMVNAQTKKPTNAVYHKPVNKLGGQDVAIKSKQPAKPTSNLTINGGGSIRKPNNFSADEIKTRKPATKTTVKHK